MKKIMLIVVLLLFIAVQAQALNLSLYNRVLIKYTYRGWKNGVNLRMVRYKKLAAAMKNPSSGFSRLLRSMRTFNPAALPSKKHKAAFWINAYNIGAMVLIAKHYPVSSIRSMKIHFFKYPWKKKVIEINNRWYSLHVIEHEILLKRLRRLDAHFGIVCASVSCPELAPRAYTAGNLNGLLRAMAVRFFKDSKKGLRIDRKNTTVHVSRIFKYDSKNFGQGKKVIIPFVLRYITDKKTRAFLMNKSYKLKFLNYDWSLNGR